MNDDKLVRRFLLRSPDALTDRELLTLLLRFAGEDADERAGALLAQFPNVAAVMEAEREDLAVIDGLDEDCVLLLRLVPELHRRYFLSRSQTDVRLTDGASIGRYLLPYFYGAKDELVYLLSLDAAGKVLNCRLIGHGSVNSANVPARRMVQAALANNASAVVLAHNHPSGIAIPSKEDIQLTLRLREAFDVLDILLIDHIIIADDDYVSLRDSGYLYQY